MKNIIIYDTDWISRCVGDILSKPYCAYLHKNNKELINIVGYIGADSKDNNITTYDMSEVLELYRNHEIDWIIVPRNIILNHNAIIWILLFEGVDINDVYVTKRLENKEYNEINTVDFITPYVSTPFLSYLEYHIADHCNLNCAACEHYSGLVEGEIFPIFSKFKNDLCKLKEYIDDIGTIRILGGEPLLNKEINKYIELTRKLYPYTNIFIVTNALLLKAMPDDFYDTIRKNNAIISISFYKPLEHTMPLILEFLKSKNVYYTIGEVNETFTIKQTLKRHNNKELQFFQCFQSRCNNLYDGKIAACFLPFTTKYFNKYFSKSLPEDGAIDLYDNTLILEELKLRLCIPFERCSYCTSPKEIKWRSINKPSNLDDWINDNI